MKQGLRTAVVSVALIAMIALSSNLHLKILSAALLIVYIVLDNLVRHKMDSMA